ncbi:tetratricopeptide repeat protein [Actinoplanes sp. NPDC049265]|uniref:tetratricopeptide repeat protein n=1 Tax=Actinoplanes sp. NPDC049265 TaxID=3363902 RepID=UPI0037137102
MSRATQVVAVESGYAYGVVGADIHVLGDGTPAYVLENWRPAGRPDPDLTREMPSRLLNARFAVVEFTGRTRERDALIRWRDAGAGLAVRWFHGPGGIGKSRLAAELAAASVAAGWKVVDATHGPGGLRPPPGSQILAPDGHAGLLLIVDYADRWPATHLDRLFDNSLLHRAGVPTRVLLIARATMPWPAVREMAVARDGRVSAQELEALPAGGGDARQRMYDAAVTSFARHYGREPTEVPPKDDLTGEDLGLVLALHMAALVAVDADARGATPPPTVEGLTIYLLDREQAHWPAVERTPPPVMRRAVFTAALTGELPRTTGVSVLGRLNVRDAETVLTDHAVLYPPERTATGSVLAPMYPDRLAEDFLALTLPGHRAEYPAKEWATAAVPALLRSEARTPHRAIAMLAAAADRWPHVGRDHLHPLLRAEPELAITAGSTALGALAGIREPDLDVLEAIDALLPAGEDVDLDVGAAAISHALVGPRLAVAADTSERAAISEADARRLASAGRYDEALAASGYAVSGRESGGADAAFASALNLHATLLADVGRDEEARSTLERSVEIHRGLADRPSPEADPEALAAALENLAGVLITRGADAPALEAAAEAETILGRLAGRGPEERAAHAASRNTVGVMLSELGRDEEALPHATAAVADYRDLARGRPGGHLPDLAMALHNLGACQSALGQTEAALATTAEAVEIRRRLVAANPVVYRPDLAGALVNLATVQHDLGAFDDALVAAGEAVGIDEELARDEHSTHLAALAEALNLLGVGQWRAGRKQDALATTERSVAIERKLVAGNPGRRADLAKAVNNLSIRLTGTGRPEQALAAAEEAIRIWRELSDEDPVRYRALLAGALMNGGVMLAGAGRCDESLPALAEALRIRRRVARERPETRPDLALTLWRYAWAAEKCGAQLPAALDFARQAFDIYLELAEARPEVFAPLLKAAAGTVAALRDAVAEPS